MRDPSQLECFEGYDFILLNLPEQWRGSGSGRLGIYVFTEYMFLFVAFSHEYSSF